MVSTNVSKISDTPTKPVSQIRLLLNAHSSTTSGAWFTPVSSVMSVPSVPSVPSISWVPPVTLVPSVPSVTTDKSDTPVTSATSGLSVTIAHACYRFPMRSLDRMLRLCLDDVGSVGSLGYYG